MKKIVLLLSLVLCAAVSFAQSGYVNTTTTGSATTLFKSKGYLGSDSAFILLQNVADTTTANFSGASLYNGAFIRVGTSIYYRTLSPKKWNLFATGSIPDQFNPAAGYAITLSGTYPNITFTVDTGLVVPYTDTLKLYGIATKSNVNLKVNISDTAAMLSNLLRKSDTLTMLSGYARTGNVVPNTRTINTNAPLVGGGDLSSDRTFLIDTGRANAEVVTGGSLNKVRDSLQANITASVSGVSSVSTTDNYGISSSVANPTSTPNISIGVDTSLIIPYTDTLKINGIATKTDINNARTGGTVTSVSAGVGMNFTTITTTGSVDADTLVLATRLHVDSVAMRKLNINDTATMLSNLLRKTDTSNMLLPYLRKTDTATMLTGYTRVQRFLDTTSTLRTLINTKGTGTVTSVGFIAPSFLTISNSPITSSGNITATLANQNANYGFFGPTSGSPASPTFRAAVIADIPDLSSLYLPITDTASMLTPFVRTYSSQTISGVKTFTDIPRIAAISPSGIQYYDTDEERGYFLGFFPNTSDSSFILNYDGSPGSATRRIMTAWKTGEISIPNLSVQGVVTNTSDGLLSSSSGTGYMKMSGGIISYDNSTIPTDYYIGTTLNSLSRSSASQTLTGVSIDGNSATATTTSNWSGNTYVGGSYSSAPTFLMGFDGTDWRSTTATGVQSFLGLGSNAYTSTAFVPQTTTVAGFPLSGNITLADLSATNSTLTFSGTYNASTARTVGLNLGNANTWTASQTFSNPVTINSSTSGLILNRPTTSNYTGVSLQTGAGEYWLFGMRENLTSNNAVLYNASTGHDVATFNTSTDATTFYGSVTASSFIKSGGTSTQSLIADGSVLTVAPGTYTASSSSLSNLTSATPGQFLYSVVGSIVTFSGSVAVVVTSTGATSMDISLPGSYTSNFTGTDDCSGSGSVYSDAKPVQVTGDATTDKIHVSWTAATTGSQQVTITGQYTIK